jgi:hypothetical protein
VDISFKDDITVILLLGVSFFGGLKAPAVSYTLDVMTFRNSGKREFQNIRQ